MLIVLITFVGVTLGSNVRDPQVPCLYAATVSTDENVKGPQEVHDAFIVKQDVQPTDYYRFGYKIHDPNTGTIISQYEIRRRDFNLGIYNKIDTKKGHRSTVNYTVDATNGYRAAVSLGEHTTLDYAHFPSPLASATPPNDEREAFENFLFDDRENIEKYSPLAISAYKTHNNLKHHFHLVPTHQRSWGYEIEGTWSQYETHRGASGEGRVTMISADGCVSSMDYKVDANNFNVSTIRNFGKQDISQLYLNPQHYPLLLQIALGSSKCDV